MFAKVTTSNAVDANGLSSWPILFSWWAPSYRPAAPLAPLVLISFTWAGSSVVLASASSAPSFQRTSGRTPTGKSEGVAWDGKPSPTQEETYILPTYQAKGPSR